MESEGDERATTRVRGENGRVGNSAGRGASETVTIAFGYARAREQPRTRKRAASGIL